MRAVYRRGATGFSRRPLRRAVPGALAGRNAVADDRYARHPPPVCTWNAARRTALASAASGWAAASATSTWTVRG